jgi:flagellar assembly protein FliH
MARIISAPTKPFAFDTEFDGSGAVIAAGAFRPAKRAYLPAEVEALVAQARLQAREEALAEVESVRAMALAAIGEAVARFAPALARVAQANREQAASLALEVGRALAAGALERLPHAPLQAALEQLGQELDASPRLVVRASGLDETARAEIETLCADAGFRGLVAFRDEPGMAGAAFTLEWADGRADFDPAEAAGRIAQALNLALNHALAHPPSDEALA